MLVYTDPSVLHEYLCKLNRTDTKSYFFKRNLKISVKSLKNCEEIMYYQDRSVSVQTPIKHVHLFNFLNELLNFIIVLY